jgi:hypothetical protein
LTFKQNNVAPLTQIPGAGCGVGLDDDLLGCELEVLGHVVDRGEEYDRNHERFGGINLPGANLILLSHSFAFF